MAWFERNDFDEINVSDLWTKFHDFFMNEVMHAANGIHIQPQIIDRTMRIRRKLSEDDFINMIKNLKCPSGRVIALNKVWNQYNKNDHVSCIKDFKDKSIMIDSPRKIADMANRFFISRMNSDILVKNTIMESTIFDPFQLTLKQVKEAILDLKTLNASGILLMSGKMLQITLDAFLPWCYSTYSTRALRKVRCLWIGATQLYH